MSSEKLRRSRQRLLDLTLRNRLLNFRPGHPNYRDDLKAHKHIVLKGQIDSVWQQLVRDEKHIEILGLTREQQAQVAQELRQKRGAQLSLPANSGQSLTTIDGEQWEDIRGSVRGILQLLQKGTLISLLPEEAFQKRLTKIRNEQNTLANSTGDSALFLALGFLEWSESEPHPRAGEALFAPLILLHVNLYQGKKEEGGAREFLVNMDVDQPQGNPCLAEKLRQDFAIDLPELNDEENADDYFSRVRRALRSKKNWTVSSNIALGFFNFARYRLWLDLNPSEWPEGTSPIDHPIVNAILNGDPLPQNASIPDDAEVANHQETEDLPIVLDSDSTQYAALLAAHRDVSLVVQGPPGSGKSQTITNLIAVALKEGKRVLFVAQKLPALQVVQRRLESVELAAFCLPLFSDKARVTEMHAHFLTSVRMRENPGWTRTLSNPVVAVASKLNGHATRLREQPAGFNQSVCSLIQRATALNLMLRDAWGNQWEDELLEISVPDVEAPGEWLETREQTLHKWHRLLTEVGNTWSHWTPLKLGPMDTQQVEAVIREQQQAAAALAEGLVMLPEEFRDLTVAKIEQLTGRISKSRFTILEDVLPNLLGFLWQATDNAVAVARLERDLEEFYRQSASARKHLRINADNRDYVAARATEALNAVAAVVNPRCSVSSVKVSLNELNETLNRAQDLFAYANLNSTGISTLRAEDQASPAQLGITWKDVECLANHRSNPDLRLPSGCKLQLALYVLEDAVRHSEARVLAQRLSRYHTSVARLKLRIANGNRIQDKGPTANLDESVRRLGKHSLGRVRLCELPELEQTFSHVADSLRRVAEGTKGEFSARVFQRAVPSIADLRHLAVLRNLPSKLLQVPTNGTETVILRLTGTPNPSSALVSLSAAVRSYQAVLSDLSGWFPEIQIGEPVEAAYLDVRRQAASIIRELGLKSQTLKSVMQLKERVEIMRKAVQATLDTFNSHFKQWPRLPPESLGHVHLAKALFLLLIHRPQVPKDVSVEALCTQANAEMISAAIAESHELHRFRAQNAGQVVFRDLPDVEMIAAHKYELRSLAEHWWRWFSRRYRKARKFTRSFVKRPFSSDQEALAFLDELEAHERRRIAFQDSPAVPLVGGVFRGIETNWQSVQATLDWIRELKSATQSSDVTPFVQSSVRSTESLRDGVRVIEILGQLVDQNRQEFSSIASLPSLSADPWTVKLEEFAASLVRTETLLKGVVDRIQGQLELQPHATFSELTSRIAQLESLQQLMLDLSQHAALAEPVEAAKFHVGALEESTVWLAELARFNVAPQILDAIISGNLERNRHFPLIQDTAVCVQQIDSLNKEYFNQEASGFSGEMDVADLESMLALLLQATVSTHTQAVEWTFDEHLTILELMESLDDVHEIEVATKTFGAWEEILRDDPALLSPDHLTTTLDWLDSLREHGAVGGMLRWLLVDETDNRLHWWQELVVRAKDLRRRVRDLQDSFALSLHETQSTATLATWSSETADRNAKTMSALEVIESHSQSSDFTVHDLAQATAALRRALDLEIALQGWKERVGVDPTRIDVARVQNHRQWVAVARGLSPIMGNWLVATDTTRRCQIVIGLEAKLTALKNAMSRTQDSLASFGHLRGDGPFAILSMTGTSREIEQRCNAFTEKVFLLPSYAALLREGETAKKLGITNLIKRAEGREVSTNLLIDTFRGAVAYQQAKAIWEADDELRYFQSDAHERLRQKFQGEDEKQLKTNRRFIQTRLANVAPTEGMKGRTAGEHTQYSLLRWEMEKQRRHLPIRKLVQRAGQAMQELCPCWMMTPLAVAQFLPPGAITFDVVIMDEASQINPEDAWGAIARGKQLVVVGDQKQMPPSDFFTSALEEDESPDEEEELDGGKSESILDASVASLLSSSLLWHYRSRHETLIAPANSFSYDNRLILFPHPQRSHTELGVRYQYIPNAITTVGKVTNAAEADAVAQRVRELVLREYAKAPKERMSIGVVTMNLPQQDCVMDLLERMQRVDARFDVAMTALGAEQTEEPLFVRNLENIQGDERDIMIISCTYGPHTANGTPTQRFGPLTREGGERRFNVLITRAKWRMEVFASLRSDQIMVDGKRQGIRDFHLFLKYAETGILVDRGEPRGKQHDSPFEAQVEAVLRKVGFDVERQVGVAGYFIDLAVKHPHHKGLFALGVECDGATYHSSRAARDRDRLREKVLLERGWKLHRIWSTDWFVNPKQAIAKLIEAVNRACK